MKESNKPLVLFFILAFIIAWCIMALPIAKNLEILNFQMPTEPLLLVGSWVPNIAAFLVLGFYLGQRREIGKLIRGWIQLKIPFRWFLAALSPILIVLVTLGIYRLVYGMFPLNEAVLSPISFIGLVVMITITGAMGEELGWRGFALPRLQKRMSSLMASLLLGVIWVLWHLPLWFAGIGFEEIPYWAYAVTGISFTILVTWVFNHTGGSMAIASLFHLTLNISVNIIESSALPVHAFVFLLFAITVVVLNGPKKLSRSGIRV